MWLITLMVKKLEERFIKKSCKRQVSQSLQLKSDEEESWQALS